ncbi:MAG: hypothetical protein K2X49_21755 [Acetobacteraceae bacterium]|nr:hypothetical protein [Acetobacteraceae bacterium]
MDGLIRAGLQAPQEGHAMSGSDVAGKFAAPAPGGGAGATAERAAPDRLAWPAASLLVLLLSAGLWFGIGLGLRRLFG